MYCALLALRGLKGGRLTNSVFVISHLRILLEHVLTEWKAAGKTGIIYYYFSPLCLAYLVIYAKLNVHNVIPFQFLSGTTFWDLQAISPQGLAF